MLGRNFGEYNHCFTKLINTLPYFYWESLTMSYSKVSFKTSEVIAVGFFSYAITEDMDTLVTVFNIFDLNSEFLSEFLSEFYLNIFMFDLNNYTIREVLLLSGYATLNGYTFGSRVRTANIKKFDNYLANSDLDFIEVNVKNTLLNTNILSICKKYKIECTILVY